MFLTQPTTSSFRFDAGRASTSDDTNGSPSASSDKSGTRAGVIRVHARGHTGQAPRALIISRNGLHETQHLPVFHGPLPMRPTSDQTEGTNCLIVLALVGTVMISLLFYSGSKFCWKRKNSMAAKKKASNGSKKASGSKNGGRFFSNEVLYPKRIYEIQAEEGCLIYPPPINVWECAASEGTKALRWPMQDLLKPALSPKRSIQTAILMLGNGGSEKPKTCEVPHSAWPSKAVRKYGVFGAPV